MRLKKTGPYSQKPYQCETCGREETHGTNHWGFIYPYCRTCDRQTSWKCLEEIPEGYTIPEKWTFVRLGDVCEIS